MIRCTVNAITYSLAITGIVYDVTSVSAYLTICSTTETRTSLICVKRYINCQGSLLHINTVYI